VFKFPSLLPLAQAELQDKHTGMGGFVDLVGLKILFSYFRSNCAFFLKIKGSSSGD